MIGIAIGVGTALVPFLFSKLAGRSARSTEDGWLRTHTMREPVTREGTQLPSLPLPPSDLPLIDPWASQSYGTQPATPAPTPMPTPPPQQQIEIAPPLPSALPPSPPTPPVPVITPADDRAQELAALRAIVDNPTPANLAMLRDPTRRDEIEELLRYAPADLAARARALMVVPSSEPRPWDGPEQTRLPTAEDLRALPAPPAPPAPPPFMDESVTQTVTPELPPQERGELPPELQQLPAQSAPAAAPLEAPPTGYDPVKARNLAKQVAANVQNRQYSYSRDLVKQFQRFAGIADDGGLYGGEVRGALIFFGVRRPPVALFKPTETIAYKWANWGG